MMKGTVDSPVAALMQESFGCSIANRFYQLLDDESDPFDILSEVERRRHQRKKREEAAEAAARTAGSSGRTGGGKRESQKQRKQPGNPSEPWGTQEADLCYKTNSHTSNRLIVLKGYCAVDLKVKRPIQGPSKSQVLMKKFLNKSWWLLDSTRKLLGRVEDTSLVAENECSLRKVLMPAQFDIKLIMELFESEGVIDINSQKQAPNWREQQGFNNRRAEVKQAKNEQRPYFERYRSNETESQVEPTVERRMKIADKKSGSGAYSWRRVKDDTSGMEQTTPVEETAETDGQPRASGGESLNKVPEGETMEEVVKEMTLDEWKRLQQRNRLKPEFNIRKPESIVLSRAVVIHKSKYSNHLQKEYYEDDSHVFRRPVNDITSQLDINFGSLPRPGRGSRGARGGGRGRQAVGRRLQSAVELVAPNPDDPEDFPALA
ncbi:intracellular hyaluronan-binding protein 4 [Melopsittacus undulatus]|uniref:intracellular hyaluronan-binding protein 4 n=1 Tax=Melopsittacus undulatus TaxID=13146 RepID=UPI00146E62CA|nr:intracellular hyaluronan-binding protein 4 [Melopsittacus undulatus]